MLRSLTIWHSTGFATLYAMGAYFFFLADIIVAPLSVAFCCAIPLAFGAVLALTAPMWVRKNPTYRVIYGIFMPWVPTVILCAVGVLVAGEAFACVLMAAPFFMILSSISGYFIMVRNGDHDPLEPHFALGAVMMIPLLFGWAEERLLERRDHFSTVETQILIQADAATIWEQMVDVPAISRAEWGTPLYSLMGLPQPVEATVDQHGLGGVRAAVYANGMRLHEPITLWQPGERLSFDVIVDPASPKPYRMEGGDAFDVQQVAFWLEPTEGGTILHLTSDYRLTTPFNWYGQHWVNLFLRDLQNNLLRVIKARAEQA